MAQGSKGLGFMHLTYPVTTFPNEFKVNGSEGSRSGAKLI